VGKGKEQGGFWPKGHLLPSWLASEQRGGEAERVVGRQGCPLAAPCSSATDEWREMERRPRGFDSPTYLGLWRRVGVDRRRRADGGGAGYGRRAPVLKQGRKVVVVVRGRPGSGRPLFICGISRFGRPIFSSSRSFYGRQWRWENIPAWTSAGEAPCGAAL
jgi:hypothetical protein